MSAAKHSSFGEAVARATRLGVSQLTSSCVSTKFFEEPTFNVDLGKKCFAFAKLDAGEIVRIKKTAFGTETGKGKGK